LSLKTARPPRKKTRPSKEGEVFGRKGGRQLIAQNKRKDKGGKANDGPLDRARSRQDGVDSQRGFGLNFEKWLAGDKKEVREDPQRPLRPTKGAVGPSQIQRESTPLGGFGKTYWDEKISNTKGKREGKKGREGQPFVQQPRAEG